MIFSELVLIGLEDRGGKETFDLLSLQFDLEGQQRVAQFALSVKLANPPLYPPLPSEDYGIGLPEKLEDVVAKLDEEEIFESNDLLGKGI